MTYEENLGQASEAKSQKPAHLRSPPPPPTHPSIYLFILFLFYLFIHLFIYSFIH